MAVALPVLYVLMFFQYLPMLFLYLSRIPRFLAFLQNRVEAFHNYSHIHTKLS